MSTRPHPFVPDPIHSYVRTIVMDAALHQTKRALASSTHASIPTRVTRTPTSPAATASANWAWLHAHAHASPSVPAVLAATTWRAGDVWKAARKGQLGVEAQFRFPYDETWTPVVEWLDGLRAHWRQLFCVVHTHHAAPQTLEWTYEATPDLTLEDVCARVEAAAFGGEATHAGATTWAFVVEAPGQGPVNTRSAMGEPWWSAARLGATPTTSSQVDVLAPPTLSVYPLDPTILADAEMLDAMGLEGNRRAHATKVRAQADATLREAQDADYYVGLAADQARETAAASTGGTGAAEVVVVDDSDDEGKMEEEDADSDNGAEGPSSSNPLPLTPAQLREARLAFYQPHARS